MSLALLFSIASGRKYLLAGCLAAAAPSCAALAAASDFSAKPDTDVTIGFGSVPDGTFTHYMESGFTLKAPLASGWAGSSGYGNPAPFIEFKVPSNEKTTAHLTVTESGSTFTFQAVDLYASVSTVTYRFKGFLKGQPVYADGGNTGNLYGDFRTFFNKKKNAKVPIDKLDITMTDSSAIGDLAGLDNIVLAPAGAKSH